VQAIGAALLSANSVAIVVAAAGVAQRGRALGIQSAAQAVGLSAGPAIGGLILDALDWRWVFFINVPVGLAGTVLGWFVLPPTKDLPDDSRFDWKGTFLIAPALTAFIAVLDCTRRRRALRPARPASAHRIGNAHLHRRAGTAVRRARRRARKPAAGDVRSRALRNRPGVVHLSQQ